MTIDKVRIMDKLNDSKKYLVSLENVLHASFEEFEQELSLQLQGERIFEIFNQIMLDICTHIVSNSAIETPRSYVECIKALGKLEIFSTEDITTFISMIKMRNLVVHQYGRVDVKMLFDSLKKLEVDFLRFQNGIISWLKKKNEK